MGATAMKRKEELMQKAREYKENYKNLLLIEGERRDSKKVCLKISMTKDVVDGQIQLKVIGVGFPINSQFPLRNIELLEGMVNSLFKEVYHIREDFRSRVYSIEKFSQIHTHLKSMVVKNIV